MKRQICLTLTAIIVAAFLGHAVNAQTSRKSVSGAEVTGTFRYAFTGKFRRDYNEIKILALGKGKLKVSFDLLYPFIDGNGEKSANMGQLDGTAKIVGDTATLTSTEFGPCTITIKFVRPGTIRVAQEGDDAACGFGHNVTADGTYKKVSSARPNFKRSE
jgi:hypothetical protein